MSPAVVGGLPREAAASTSLPETLCAAEETGSNTVRDSAVYTTLSEQWVSLILTIGKRNPEEVSCV